MSDAPILAIESSCDETAVAIYGASGLLSHALHSQIKLHALYGGVVPELASRDHVTRVLPLIRSVLSEAGLKPSDLGGIAYTAGPGLVGALMVGASAAAGLATALELPLIAVHHMEGHLLAPLLEEPTPSFPFVALLVSGGRLWWGRGGGVCCVKLSGGGLVDVCGGALDKPRRLLGLPYPGGPELAKLAETGIAGRYKLPRPMTDRPGLDFSFSGLKTAVLTALPKNASAQDKADLARGFEDAVTETLAIKCERALRQTGYRRLIVAGGVGANLRLRARLGDLAERTGIAVHFPRQAFCTDNAAMIALVGWLRRSDGQIAPAHFSTRARWPLTELAPPTTEKRET